MANISKRRRRREVKVVAPKVRLNTLEQGYQYVEDVLNDKIVTSKYIKLACLRFNADLERFKKKDSKYIFKEGWVVHFLDFVNNNISHVQGSEVNKRFYLEDWQVFMVMNLFGFVKRSNHNIRRFKHCLLFIARKNGKSFFSSVLPIYFMIFGDEGQRIFSVATKRDQAKIVWQAAGRMIIKLPKKYRELFSTTISEIRADKTDNTYKALGRDSSTLDGLNPTLTVFDEAAAILDRDLIEVMTSATGSRDNYLNLYITTASTVQTTILFENYQACKKILEKDISDDGWFALIYEMDNEKEIKDPLNWVKSNPNLGISINQDYLEAEYTSALNTPSKMANFMVKNLNVWRSSSEVWLDTKYLSKSIIDEIDTSGDAFVGFDLGSVSDLTAATFIFRHGTEYHFKTICFLPKESLENRVPKHLKQVYNRAVEEKNLILMDGEISDLNEIAEYIFKYALDNGFNLKLLCYDFYQSQGLDKIAQEHGVQSVIVSQKMLSLSPTAKEMERLFISGKIKHEENLFFKWQFENVHKFVDVNGNIKLRKGKDQELKVDSVIALNIGMVHATQHEEDSYICVG